MGLIAWYPLIKDTKNYGLDSTPLSVMGSVPFNDGKLGKSATFTGNCANCLYRTAVLPTKNFSITFWFKASQSSLQQHIVCQGRDYSVYGIAAQANSNILTLRYGTNSSSNITTITYDIWYHVGIVYAESGIEIYLNGVLFKTVGYVEANYQEASNTFTIGKMSYSYTTTTNYFPLNGQVNDVRIWDECISGREIYEISRGLVAHYPLNEESTFCDCSGYNNHTSFTANAPTLKSSVAGTKHMKYYEFNGSDNAVLCGRGAMVKDELSVSLWVEVKATNTSYTVASCTEGGGWSLAVTNGKVVLYVGMGASSNTYTNWTSTGSVAVGWHHIAFTVDGKAIKLYIDGNLDSSKTPYTTKTPLFYVNNGLIIGAEASESLNSIAGSYYNGGISDVKIFATALTETDVKALYQQPVSIGLKLDMYVPEIYESTSVPKFSKNHFLTDYYHEYYEADDGSIFITLLDHYNNNGSYLFTSSNWSNNHIGGLYSRLYLLQDAQVWFLNNNTFEFIALQPVEEPGKIYRWKQTSNPYISTTLSGFTNISNMTEANALKKVSSNTGISAANNGWWCAVGCYTAYQGGIPGFGGKVVKNTLLLLARVNKEYIKMFNNEAVARKICEI